MNKLRTALRQQPIIKRASSLKITVTCLGLLFILVLLGTIAQVDHGLYFAQKQFFHSWIFLLYGFLPFPGAQLILWVLFINLACVSITRFVYKKSHLGIVIIHIGLLTYFISAFVTFVVTKETNLTLLEGEGSNVATAYHQWELSVWPQTQGSVKKVFAFDTDTLKPKTNLSFLPLEFDITVESYYPNAKAFRSDSPVEYKNQSGIAALTSVKREAEPEKNIPGGTFMVRTKEGIQDKLLLYGAEINPTPLRINGKPYLFQLRRKRMEIPFVLTLKSFEAQMHPGTEIAKSFKSLVDIAYDRLNREVLIWMNHPLRYKDFTFYQASYSIDHEGRERSTLAVVKNPGQWLPYISSGITFLGLVIHLFIMAFTSKRRKVSRA